MPSEGVELSPDGNILTNDEVIRLATLFVKSGVTKIRLTGGEPTVRKDIEELIGVHDLRSMDTLDPFKFELITRRRGHDAVLKALDVALSSSLHSIKLNVVVIKGLNDSEIVDFVEMTKDDALSVRFIEFMPFTGNKWDSKKMVPSVELLKRLSIHYPNLYRASDELNDTARSWKIPDYAGSFGFISSMSDHFCSSCNRLRITADGQIKVCLFDAKEVSLRDEMRKGASDEELLHIIGNAVSDKKEKHAGMEDIDVVKNRPMILIGDNWNTGQPHLAMERRFLKPTVSTRLLTPHTPTPTPRTILAASLHTIPTLTHLDCEGRASMVNIADKQPTKRIATASGRIYIPPVAYELVTSSYPILDTSEPTSDEEKARKKARKKGDALTVAQLAAIMGAKKTSDLIPLCHPLPLTQVAVTLNPANSKMESGAVRYYISCEATVATEGKTGVEMEALTAVSVGLLTVWDMLKAVAGREMEIGEIKVTRKSGGRSGDFVRDIID
ncbi:hypothetical protein C0989_012550 [Termitomyces sp. Mn162]|nr:hypothetical protein C0989_012550 [Termitomyces sp. Mn162]